MEDRDKDANGQNAVNATPVSNGDEVQGWETTIATEPQEGVSYLVFEENGGWWADAEKRPGDDRAGNPTPVNPGEEDDLMCWAATDANMLEYSGWGISTYKMDFGADDFFQNYQDHVTDGGNFIDWGLAWWFNGTLRSNPGSSYEDVQGGNYWSKSYQWSDYVKLSSSQTMTVQEAASWLSTGNVVGLDIRTDAGGAHAITCWGFNYDPTVNKDLDPQNYYKGLWVTDSDSDKGSKLTAGPIELPSNIL